MPGRLCLFGEHSDWAGAYRRMDPEVMPGYCLAVGTTQGISAQVARNDGFLHVDSRVVHGESQPFAVPMSDRALDEAARGGAFYSYCAGVAGYLNERYRVGGITIQTASMNLPLKKGLSSSAAICVLTARAFNQEYNLNMSLRDEMESAYLGEIRTGSQCGRMDQVCAYGQTPVFLTFSGDEMDVDPLRPVKPIHLVIVDLQKEKNTRTILHDLNAAFTSFSSIGSQVRDALGPQNRRILHEARDAINAGDEQAVGGLMTEAQAIFDRQIAPASPHELASPKLHAVLSHRRVADLSWGGKGVGSQGEGCAQIVARGPDAQRQLLDGLPAILNVRCFELTILPIGGST